MKSDYLRNKIARIVLALSFLLGIGLAASPAAQAQRPWDRDRQDRVERERRERARENQRARENRRDRDYDRDRDYNRNRNDQYSRNRVYNERVYNNGVYNNGNYGGNGGYGGYGNASQVAINQGYQDGLYTGSSDAQRRQSYDPQRSHFYKNGHGDSGGYYGNGYGYQQAYRDGFLRGYNEGYRRNGGYNSNRRFPW